MIKYFAYGSNMDQEEIKKHCSNITGPFRGKIKNFELVFNKRSKKNPENGFCNITPKWGSVVEGSIYLISEDDVRRLDKKEGYPIHYEKTLLEVYWFEYPKVESCLVYIATPQWLGENLKVSPEYAAKLIRGSSLLTEEYRNNLQKKLSLLS